MFSFLNFCKGAKKVLSKKLFELSYIQQRILYKHCFFLKQTILFRSYILNKLNIYTLIPYNAMPYTSFFIKKNNLMQYKSLTDIVCVDLLQVNYIRTDKRFLLVYNFLSHKYSSRLFIICLIGFAKFQFSISQNFKAADWMEREIYDMFGIFFDFKNNKRIFTDYGFYGYPLRKEFPLTGFFEIYFNNNLNKISFKKITLSQEFRNYKFNNPWLKKK